MIEENQRFLSNDLVAERTNGASRRIYKSQKQTHYGLPISSGPSSWLSIRNRQNKAKKSAPMLQLR